MRLFSLITLLFLSGAGYRYYSKHNQSVNDKAPARSPDQVVEDYVRAIQTSDTALFITCFHPHVYTLMETDGRTLASEVFSQFKRINESIQINFERTPYHHIGEVTKMGMLEILPLYETWKITYKLRTPTPESKAEFSKFVEILKRYQPESLMEMQRVPFSIPEEVKWYHLDQQKQQFVQIKPELVRARFDPQSQEYRLVPQTYVGMMMLK